MLRIDIGNFRSFRKINFEDESKLILVVGYNGAGKSTLKEAIAYAFTGEAFGYRGRGVSALLTHGETQGLSVRVHTKTIQVHRTITGGDAIKAVAARLGVDPLVLPLAFNMTLCGDGGSKAMGLFLSGAASATFDPFVHFANDPGIKCYLDLCRKAGKLEPRAIISYAAQMRALQKPPPEPVRPGGNRPAPEDIDVLASARKLALDEQNVAQAEKNAAAITCQEMNAILQYARECAAYEQARAASTEDALGDARRDWSRIAAINVQTLTGMATVLGGHCEEAANSVLVTHDLVQAAVAQAQGILQNNPVPSSMPSMPVFPEKHRSVYDELGTEVTTDITLLRSLVEAADCALREAQNKFNETKSTVDDVERALCEAQKSAGAWEAYDKALPEWETNTSLIRAEWQRWDQVVKAVEAAEAAHLSTIGDTFGKTVSELSSAILNGRRVSVSRENGITLGSIPINELSGSEKWRVELSVCAAIAQMLKAPILTIDGADILDINNRAALTRFLLERVTPHFDHCIVTMTATGRLEDEKGVPDGLGSVSKYILDNNKFTLLPRSSATI